MATFIHAADLHLGLGITRFPPEAVARLQEARFQALENILHQAKEHNVDFLLLCGDLFDHSAVDTVTARRAFRLLESANAPVFILPGNHDPLVPGSVWDRDPWNNPSPSRICVLRQNEPTQAPAGVMLFPCPVRRKSSFDDPTDWIKAAPESRDHIRLGVAHGSIRDRENLPLDDHLISRYAATAKNLDYLAMGHWHRYSVYPDSDGVPRAAYSGVHEPMAFENSPASVTGWLPNVSGQDREEFLGVGQGQVLLVNISAPGEHPFIQPLRTGHLTWRNESRSFRNEADVSAAIRYFAGTVQPERTVLQFKLEGLLPPRAMLRLEELQRLLNRFLHAEIDRNSLHITPNEEDLREIARSGVLRLVLEQLSSEVSGNDADATGEAYRRRSVAERALLILYRIAREVQQSSCVLSK